ncbi:DsbA family protein (plasmid) [Serratia ureilytica]
MVKKTSDVVNTKDVLLETKFTPNYGPDNADVAVIEFFDYMCHFCQQSSPVLEKAIAENKMFGLSLKTSPFLLTAHLSPGWGQKLVSTSLISTGRKNTTSSIISS